MCEECPFDRGAFLSIRLLKGLKNIRQGHFYKNGPIRGAITWSFLTIVKHQTIEAVSSLSFPQFLTGANKVPGSLIITRYGPH